MDVWSDFYERLFKFREIRYFDIEGKLTGLKSRAMTSPGGKIRIPINESADDKSQIEEYLARLSRRGHPAYRAGDRRYLCHGRGAAPRQGVRFMAPPPDTYYDNLDNRICRAMARMWRG